MKGKTFFVMKKMLNLRKNNTFDNVFVIEFYLSIFNFKKMIGFSQIMAYFFGEIFSITLKKLS